MPKSWFSSKLWIEQKNGLRFSDVEKLCLKIMVVSVSDDLGINGDIGIVVEWLKRRARDQHGLGSKPTRAILLCSWERRFTPHSPAW